MTDSPDDHCASEVRSRDPDRWLTALFAPDRRRPALLALYAFNAEIARAREAVTQPMIGEIRLQWWREAWEGIAQDRPRQHPVVLALHEHCRHLDSSAAMALIDARERDMDAEPMADMAALRAYAEASSAPLMRLAAEALGARLEGVLPEAIHLAGTAYALIGLMRATPHLAAQQRVCLPADRLRAAGVEPESLYQKGLGPAVHSVIAEVAKEAGRDLDRLRQIRLNRAVLPALLPATLARAHLRRLARAGFDPESADAAATPTQQHMALVAAVWRRRV